MPAIFDKILRAGEGKILRQLTRIATQVNSVEEDFVALTDAELRAETDKFKERLADGETLDDILPEAFARRPSAPWGSGTTTCRSWAERPCTWATSRR